MFRPSVVSLVDIIILVNSRSCAWHLPLFFGLFILTLFSVLLLVSLIVTILSYVTLCNNPQGSNVTPPVKMTRVILAKRGGAGGPGGALARGAAAAAAAAPRRLLVRRGGGVRLVSRQD